MSRRSAIETIQALDALRECSGWADILLPEIETRVARYESRALSPGPDSHDKLAARERADELRLLVQFLASVEENAKEAAKSHDASEGGDEG